MTSDPAGAPPPSAAAPPATPPPTAAAPPAAPPPTPALDRPLTRREQLTYRVIAAAFRFLARLFWRVTVVGAANVPADGPFVVAPVHRSNIDTPLLVFVTKRQLRYMAKASLFKHKWSGRLLSSLGAFSVKRDTVDRESLRIAESALRRGEPVVIFPEGTRKSGPVVNNLFDGAAFAAIRNNVPIVPVGIGGSEGAMPKGSKFLRPVRIRIVIGAPIEPPSRDGVGSKSARRQVHEMTGQLEAELQRLFDQAEGRTVPLA